MKKGAVYTSNIKQKSIFNSENMSLGFALTWSFERWRFVSRVTDTLVASHEVLAVTVWTDAACRWTFVDVCLRTAYQKYNKSHRKLH